MNTKENKESLQDTDPSRRLFLKRTSISSACLIASPLLASGIMMPAWGRQESFGNGMRNALTLDEDDDFFFDQLREVSLKALELVPYLGAILSFMGALVIPTSEKTPEQRWKEIIDKINNVVDNKISEAVRALVESDLRGMTDLTEDYIKFVKAGGGEGLKQWSISCEVTFRGMMPRFQTKGHEKSLINLYTIAANMHLGLLRDIVLKGRELGFSESDLLVYKNKLTDSIKTYGAHVDRTIEGILSDVADKNAETKFNRNEPLASVLKTKAQYQLTSLDIRAIWPYFDAAKYPDKVRVRLDREIFSPLRGSYFDKQRPVPRSLGDIALPKDRLLRLKIRHHEFIDGITLVFNDESEVSIGGIGGKEEIYIPDGTITRGVVCEYASAIAALSFIRQDGSMSRRFGDFSGAKDLQKLRIEYPGHSLSSIHGFGTAPGYGNVLSGCVFGFQLINQTGGKLSMSTMRKLAESAPAGLLPLLLE